MPDVRVLSRYLYSNRLQFVFRIQFMLTCLKEVNICYDTFHIQHMDIKFTTGHVLTVGAVMIFMQSDWLLILIQNKGRGLISQIRDRKFPQ